MAKVSKKQAASEPTAVQPKVVWKHNREHRSDLFKLEVAKCRKNVGFHVDHPDIKSVEHCHFFRNYDSKGKKRIHSSQVAGHFHECEIKVDEDGNQILEVGPAKQFGRRKIRGQYKKTIDRIRFYQGKDHTDENFLEEDKHTHDAIYLGSEIISPARRMSQARLDQGKLKQMGVEVDDAAVSYQQVPSVPKDMTVREAPPREE